MCVLCYQLVLPSLCVLIKLFYLYSPFTAVECPALAPIPNGAITYGPDMIPDFNVGTLATHSCDSSFFLTAGSDTQVCLDTGRWSGRVSRYVRFSLGSDYHALQVYLDLIIASQL